MVSICVSQARSSYFRSRKFSLEEYEPHTLDITAFVDGFETTNDSALLANFLLQEIEAWRESGSSRSRKGEANAQNGDTAAPQAGGAAEKEQKVSPSGAGRRLESVSEATDEAKDENKS